MGKDFQTSTKRIVRGYWVERGADGKKRICFKARIDDKKQDVKLSLKEIMEILKEA